MVFFFFFCYLFIIIDIWAILMACFDDRMWCIIIFKLNEFKDCFYHLQYSD